MAKVLSVEPQPEFPPDLPYRVTKWNNLDNYECKLCAFKTLDLLTMHQHQVTHNMRRAMGIVDDPSPRP